MNRIDWALITAVLEEGKTVSEIAEQSGADKDYVEQRIKEAMGLFAYQQQSITKNGR
jgi:hypothetical protein